MCVRGAATPLVHPFPGSGPSTVGDAVQRRVAGGSGSEPDTGAAARGIASVLLIFYNLWRGSELECPKAGR
jgi:hypothetical protein